jgi:hypothetical protein
MMYMETLEAVEVADWVFAYVLVLDLDHTLEPSYL